jgi:hypothetical protein
MPTGSNLKIRNGSYYARPKGPVELRHLMDTGELSRSLNTKDRRTANVRKLPVLSEGMKGSIAFGVGATWQKPTSRMRRRTIGDYS